MSCLAELKVGVTTKSAEETFALGRRLASELSDGVILALYGDLGSGKTTFAKGLALGLGIIDTVKSPSYNIYSIYRGKFFNFVHIDAYRLESENDYDNLLIDELVAAPKIFCIEWPENIASFLDSSALRVSFDILSDNLHLIKLL